LHIFDLLFDCLSSYLYMRVLKLTLGKIILSAIFSLFSAFQCEAFGWTWLTARTCAVLSIANLASGPSGRIGIMSRWDPYRFLSVYLLSLPSAHHFIFIDLSCHIVCLSRGFLPRFWHSLHISSHPWYLLCLPYSFKFLCFLEDWNI
jgi:hypothetical protein